MPAFLACLPSLPPLPLSRLLCILRACLPNCISLIFIFAHTHTATHTHTHTPTETQPSQTLRSRRLCQQSRPLRVLYELPLGTRHKVKISLQNFPIITCLLLHSPSPFPSFVLPLPGCCFLLQLSLSLHSETTRPPVTATLSLVSHGFVKSSNANSFQVPKSVACAFAPPPPSPAPLHSLLELQQLQSLAAPERSQNVVSNASFACSLPTPFHPSLSPPDPCTSMQMGGRCICGVCVIFKFQPRQRCCLAILYLTAGLIMKGFRLPLQA